MGIVEVLAVTFVAYVTVVAIVMIAGWHHKGSRRYVRLAFLRQFKTD
jgi:hypothetical protein